MSKNKEKYVVWVESSGFSVIYPRYNSYRGYTPLDLTYRHAFSKGSRPGERFEVREPFKVGARFLALHFPALRLSKGHFPTFRGSKPLP